MGTVILLVGPKAVGKSWVAATIQDALGIHYVDADVLILDLLASGEKADPSNGWLRWVEEAVVDALGGHCFVSVEATGEWESDYLLARRLETEGHRVVRVLLSAPEDVTVARLAARTTRKVAVSEEEARSTYARSAARTAQERWDLVLDLTGRKDSAYVTDALGQLLSWPDQK